MASTAKPISREPLKAASRADSPCSTWRKMFSSMTMASSTTSPIASTSDSSVRVLIEKPKPYITAKAPISDTGMVTSGISTPRIERRNRKMISTTRTTASAMVL